MFLLPCGHCSMVCATPSSSLSPMHACTNTPFVVVVVVVVVVVCMFVSSCISLCKCPYTITISPCILQAAELEVAPQAQGQAQDHSVTAATSAPPSMPPSVPLTGMSSAFHPYPWITATVCMHLNFFSNISFPIR